MAFESSITSARTKLPPSIDSFTLGHPALTYRSQRGERSGNLMRRRSAGGTPASLRRLKGWTGVQQLCPISVEAACRLRQCLRVRDRRLPALTRS